MIDAVCVNKSLNYMLWVIADYWVGGVVRVLSTPQVYYWYVLFFIRHTVFFIGAWVVGVGGLLGAVLFWLIGFLFCVIFVGCKFVYAGGG